MAERAGNEKLRWISLRRRFPEADLKSGRYGSRNILLCKTNKLSLSVRSEIGGPRYEVLNKHEVMSSFFCKSCARRRICMDSFHQVQGINIPASGIFLDKTSTTWMGKIQILGKWMHLWKCALRL